MKKQISIIALMLCTLIVSIKAVNINQKSKNKNPETTCACCKNCKDATCIALCKKWSEMSPEARKSNEGQKVKEECMNLCKEKKCCSADGKTATCEAMMDGKDCCKKK
jgi:hypothetical protein